MSTHTHGQHTHTHPQTPPTHPHTHTTQTDPRVNPVTRIDVNLPSIVIEPCKTDPGSTHTHTYNAHTRGPCRLLCWGGVPFLGKHIIITTHHPRTHTHRHHPRTLTPTPTYPTTLPRNTQTHQRVTHTHTTHTYTHTDTSHVPKHSRTQTHLRVNPNPYRCRYAVDGNQALQNRSRVNTHTDTYNAHTQTTPTHTHRHRPRTLTPKPTYQTTHHQNTQTRQGMVHTHTTHTTHTPTDTNHALTPPKPIYG